MALLKGLPGGREKEVPSAAPSALSRAASFVFHPIRAVMFQHVVLLCSGFFKNSIVAVALG